MSERTYIFKDNVLRGLKESEFVKLGLSRNPFIPFIPKDITGTFVNRQRELEMLSRYLPELLKGFMPLLILSGTKGIGKTHFLNYIFNQLKEIESEIEHKVISLDVDKFEEFFNRVKTGDIKEHHLVLIDDTEKVWERYKENFAELVDSFNQIKLICVWTNSKWAKSKSDSFYSSLKPVCIKISRLTDEHLIKIMNMRIEDALITNKSSPFTIDSLNYLAKVSDGVPYTAVYFCERMLHHLLNNNLSIANEQVTREFIKNAKLRKFDISKFTPSQISVLRILLEITNSEKRGATSTEIAEELGVQRPTAIEHLRNLSKNHVVEANTLDKKRLYYIKPALMGQIEEILSQEVME
jgi:DNA-binding CsgD family transcriptional regulator